MLTNGLVNPHHCKIGFSFRRIGTVTNHHSVAGPRKLFSPSTRGTRLRC